jgi:hypothetical protein
MLHVYRYDITTSATLSDTTMMIRQEEVCQQEDKLARKKRAANDAEAV